MNSTHNKKNTLLGIGFALITVVIWSYNYVVARSAAKQIPPISLGFYRWALASVFIVPLAYKKFQEEKSIIFQHKQYLFWVSLTGITLFNSFIYIAGHYTNAINLALIGTTAAPIFATFFAAFFLKEKINVLRIIGIFLCIVGIIILLSKASWQTLLAFRFEKGDLWILASAFVFAIYSTLIKNKPSNISAISFLMVIFVVGTILLIPAFIIEQIQTPPIYWNININMLFTLLYLGIGNSIIGFLCWNKSIALIGPARTVLFTNVIPIFSTIEAILILNEPFLPIHLISGIIIIAGIVIANLKH